MSRITIPFLSDMAYNKPNKYDDKYKDLPEVYFSDTAKWALFNAQNTMHSEWLDNTDRNKKFYMNKQWDSTEDIEAFLKDETGSDRNRIQVVFNQIRGIVEQYRGNAIRITINARAEGISKDVKNRREFQLGKQILKTQVADEFGDLGKVMRAQDPSIGETEKETEQIFENTYVDKLVKYLNYTIRYVAELNEMQKMQLVMAQNIAFSGFGGIDEFEYNGQLRKEVIQPEEFGWDRNARRYDLQDSAYMYRVMSMNLPSVLEKWSGISIDEKKALERFTSQESNMFSSYTTGGGGRNTGNSVPIFKVFFKDSVSKTHGYVNDDYGQPFLAVIGEEEKFSNGKIYEMKDVISPPESDRNKKIFKNGKKTAKFTADILRYCIFTPGEAVAFIEPDPSTGKKRPYDIVYEYGDYEYQETNWSDLSVSAYPFKVNCWGYVDGQILSPIDDMINPQRFINRILSATEGQINNSGGAGIVYDADSLDDDFNEDDLLRAANNGRPIKVRSRGKGVPNTVMPYDNTVKAGTYNMFGMIPAIIDHMQKVSGVNEGLKGESTGSDQLVGVTQLMIQRGSLMQEPFYNALAEIFVQSHQYTATIGKRIYIDNQRELNVIVGEEGAEVFKLSEELRNEEFRVFIKRANSDESLREQADNFLLTLLQGQIIDKEFYADLAGRSTMEDIYQKLRQSVKKEKLAAQMAAKEQQAATSQVAQEEQQAQGQMQQQAEKQQQDDLLLANANNERDKEHDMEKLVVGKMMDAEMKK